MDRRSFELNYENNILLLDRAATAAMLARQRSYLADCSPVRPEDVAAWGWHRRLWNNAMAIVGPVL
jgi:cardiolipin synthase